MESSRESSNNIKDYLMIIFTRKIAVLSVFLVITAIAVYRAITSPPVYMAITVMIYKPSSGVSSFIQQTPFSFYYDYGYNQSNSIESLQRFLYSRGVMSEILRRLEEGSLISNSNSELNSNYTIELVNQERTNFYDVMVSADSPDLAEVTANVTAEVFIEKMAEQKNSDLDNAVEFLLEQMRIMDNKLRQTEEKLNLFRQKENLLTSFDITSGRRMSSLLIQLGNMQSDLIKVQYEKELTQAQLNSIKTLMNDPKKSKVGIGVGVDPKTQWQNLVQQSIQLEAQLKSHEQEEKLIIDKISKFKSEHPNLIDKEAQLVKLEREARIYEQTYMSLMNKYEEAVLAKETNTREFNILDRAIKPAVPSGPNRIRIIVLGVLVGLILGIGGAFILEYLDDSVKRAEDVEKHSGLAVIGSIPKISVPRSARSKKADDQSLIKLQKQTEEWQGRLITNFDPKSPIVESYRSLWANIQFANVDKTIKTVLITSQSPQEGKSLTLANLAFTIAQLGTKVLFIDADLHRPRMHGIFGYNRSPGLSELIAGDLSNIEDIIRKTDVDNLYILTSGSIPPNPIELLGSEKMKQFIEEAKKKFDIVMFDSPPLIAAADSSILATRLEMVLLVVKAGKTSKRAINQAREALKKLNISIFGVILNNIDYSKQYSSYRRQYQYYTQGKDDTI